MLAVIKKPIYFLFLLLFFWGCSSDDEPIVPVVDPPTGEPVDDLFAAQLNSRLDDQVMGYSYVILRNGEIAHEGAGGLARTSEDGEMEMATDLPMHIASISKWITTVATLSVLEQNGLATSTSVAAYFPPDWTVGPGIETLTFMDLLAQRGGLNQYGTNSFNANRFDSLKQIVADGAEGLRIKLYKNNHHSLFRVILPVLDDNLNNLDGQYTPVTTGLEYEEIVKEIVFDPLNVEADLTASSLNNTVRAYANKSDTGNGLGGNVDFTEVGAAYGWHISVADLAEVWRAAWYTDILINEEIRSEMTDNTAGLFETRDGQYGRYYMKDGAWWYSSQPRRQIQTIAAHFPDDTDLLIYINSALDSNGWLGSVVIQAYEDSRIPG
ncbi:MAG: serine hydrolase domain-containing protein [Bacteroidota bacterium]